MHDFRRTETSSFGIAAGAVTGDDLYAGMISQPGGNGLGVAIGQQVDGPVALQIDDDGAVAPAAAPGPVVDANDPGWWCRLDRGRSDQPQQRVAADRHGKACGQAGAGLAAHAMRDGTLDVGEPIGTPVPWLGRIRQAFGEDAARTRRYRAAEAAYPDLEGDHAPLPTPTPSGLRRCGRTRASELQHAVEDMDGHVHLGRPTLIRTRAQPVPDHPLQPADGGLGPGALVVARTPSASPSGRARR